jgi:hypothetical protein
MNLFGKFIEAFFRITFAVGSFIIYSAIKRGEIFDLWFLLFFIISFTVGTLGHYLQIRDIKEASIKSIIYMSSVMLFTGIFVLFIEIIEED